MSAIDSITRLISSSVIRLRELASWCTSRARMRTTSGIMPGAGGDRVRGAHAARVLLRPHRAVVVEAALHLPGHRLVLVLLDAHRLELGDAVGRGVGDVAAVEPLQDGHEGVPSLRHAGGPPGAAGARHEGHHVSLAHAGLEEGGHRPPRPQCLGRREVDVVEHDREVAAPTAVGDDVGGDDRAPLWRACVARDLGHHDRLEAGERLLDTVLGDDEVVAGEAADGLALLVHDRHVDGHELDLRLERGLGRRWGGLGRLGGGAEEDETEDREGETLHVATGYRLARGRIKARAPRRRWLCLDRSRGRRCAPRRGSDRRAAPPRRRIARARSAPPGGSPRTGSDPVRRAAAGQAVPGPPRGCRGGTPA